MKNVPIQISVTYFQNETYRFGKVCIREAQGL